MPDAVPEIRTEVVDDSPANQKAASNIAPELQAPLGLVTAQAAIMERYLDIDLGMIIHEPEPRQVSTVVATIDIDYQSVEALIGFGAFGRKVDSLFKLIDRWWPSVSALQASKMLKKELHAVAEERNDLVHGVWAQNVIERKGLGQQRYTPERLTDFADRIARVTHRMHQMVHSLAFGTGPVEIRYTDEGDGQQGL